MVPGKVIHHHGFVAHLYGDAPARAKVLYFVGCFTAFLVCVYCRLCGTTKGNTRRYLGYVQPAKAERGVGALTGSSFQMGREHDAGENAAGSRQSTGGGGSQAVGPPPDPLCMPLARWYP